MAKGPAYGKWTIMTSTLGSVPKNISSGGDADDLDLDAVPSRHPFPIIRMRVFYRRLGWTGT